MHTFIAESFGLPSIELDGQHLQVLMLNVLSDAASVSAWYLKLLEEQAASINVKGVDVTFRLLTCSDMCESCA